MSSELNLAHQLDPGATEKTDVLFGRHLVCADPAAAQQVAERLQGAGHPVLWSHRINADRVFLDRDEHSSGIHRAPEALVRVVDEPDHRPVFAVGIDETDIEL